MVKTELSPFPPDIDPSSVIGLHFESVLGKGEEIYNRLETRNWAPWLRFKGREFDTQASVFPDGQILLCDDEGTPVATLSTNRINWDGTPEDLRTWDEVAGQSMTYEDTYEPGGNTLACMSISVDDSYKGKHLPHVLMRKAALFAQREGIPNLLGSFRPNGYGVFKLQVPSDASFANYCTLRQLKDGSSVPVDPWLRSLDRRGMTPIKVDDRAMVIKASAEELDEYTRDYHPESWVRLDPSSEVASSLIVPHRPQDEIGDIAQIWECGETGTWYMNNNGDTVYIESNLWGRLPI